MIKLPNSQKKGRASMKQKLLSGIAAALMSLSLMAAPASAAPRSVPVTVDGTLLPGVSYVDSGVTTVPLRALLDAVGGWNIWWDTRKGHAVAATGGVMLTAKPREKSIVINNRRCSVPTPVYIEKGRTYVPLRAVGEALGWDVEWDAALGGAAVTTRSASELESAGGAPAYTEGTASGVTDEIGSNGWTEEDLYWLSRVISAESQGESYRGQLAVGNVVLNRVASKEFPNTIKGVVFDAKDAIQFEPVANGTIYNTPTAQSVKAAKAVLSGEGRVVGDCLYFYAPALSQGLWINQNRTYYTTIGCHRFYL